MIVDFDVHIYIPLCFYYIHSCNLINFRINPIYIPLCFYYIDLCTYILNYTFTIYIPLCFYYIISIAIIWLMSLPDLHSTMFLLHRKLNIHITALNLLFTFHYVSITSQKSKTVRVRGLQFTFHYVSITSTLANYRLHTLVVFTFHYVSITSQIVLKISING